MELYPPIYGNSLYPFLLPPTYLYSLPQNYVHWNRTPESHIYTADLPGISQLSSQLQSFDTEILSVDDSWLFRDDRICMMTYHYQYNNFLFIFYFISTYVVMVRVRYLSRIFLLDFHINYSASANNPDIKIFFFLLLLLLGVRKEEIRVEVEDGRYLVIRTELDDGDDEEMEVEERRRRRFMRKFRLPEMVDVERMSAGYEDGVLTVRVPRRLLSRRPRVEDIVIDRAAEERNSVARAA